MKKPAVILFSILTILFSACTFDYGQSSSTDRDTPDLVMKNVEYIRMRSADPIARFTAERAERYEKQGVMKVQNFSFEQYGEKGEEVNAFGRAGHASIDIETGDVIMDNHVRLEVESEDIILETYQLEWKDEPRTLTSGENDEVIIFQENGTNFTGIGLWVEARTRSYQFSGHVSGIFIADDEEDEEENEKRTVNTEQKTEEPRTGNNQQRTTEQIQDISRPAAPGLQEEEEEWDDFEYSK